MTRYALIDNPSGYVWYLTDAATPKEACEIADREIGGEPSQYDYVPRFDFSNQAGYRVFEVPPGFDIKDGQDEAEIERVVTVGREVACIACKRPAYD